jgi:hypothetical protein
MIDLACHAWGRDFQGRIAREEFRVHSVFNTVCNLQYSTDRPLLALVTREEAQGPNTLLLDTIKPFAELIGERVLHSGNHLYCNEIRMDCTSITNPPVKSIEVAGNLQAIYQAKAWLEMQFPGITLQGSEVSNKLCQGLARQEVALTVEALYDLIGRGEGLTPAGDDYATGILLGFFRGQKQQTVFQSKLVQAVWGASCRTNAISRTMLWYAAKGDGAYYLTAAVDGLLSASPDALLHAAKLTRIGSSSGRYLLAGLISGCKIFLAREHHYHGRTDCG